jgi:hypothetical protein
LTDAFAEWSRTAAAVYFDSANERLETLSVESAELAEYLENFRYQLCLKHNTTYT